MPKTNRTKGQRVATSPLKRPRKKSAMDALLDRFSEIIETGAQKMDAEELRKSEKKFNDAIDRAVANKRRRETM
jgi:L-lactate utilization protein LutC